MEVLTQLGLRRISDGFFRRPIVDTRGAAWVPQQLWRLKRRRRSPWTVCYHINRWTDADVAAFRRDVARFAPALTDFATVCGLRRLPASSCHGARLVDASSLLPLSPRRPRRERDPRPPSAGEARGRNEVIDGSLSR